MQIKEKNGLHPKVIVYFGGNIYKMRKGEEAQELWFHYNLIQEGPGSMSVGSLP